MSLLLDFLYLIVLTVASPWLAYRLSRVGGWRTLPLRFGWRMPSAERGGIWLHGSSVGEVSLLKPLVALLEREMPGTPLVISAFTPTGLAAARASYPDHCVTLLPADFSFVVRRFLRAYEPRLLVVVESDYWPNLLTLAKRQGASLAVVNGKISSRSAMLYARTHLMPRVLRDIDLLAVQTDEHARRLRALGVAPERAVVTGNMKYDFSVVELAPDEHRRLREGLGYAAGEIVVIGGSLHAGEDEALLDAFASLDPRGPACALLLVPRYPSDAGRVAEHVEARGLKPVLKSAVDRGQERAPGAAGVLIVDGLGQLGRLYGVADIAFVGGSLFFRGSNKGGHNLMEPALASVPVVFGPYNFSFEETVRDLLAADAGVLVRDAAELARALEALVTDPARRSALGRRARDVVENGRGATARNLELLRGLIAPAPRLAAPASRQQNAASNQ